MKLIFPKTDKRSNGKPINDKRKWLKQGAICEFVDVPRRVFCYTSTVHFKKAPKKTYDLVSPEFLKRGGK